MWLMIITTIVLSGLAGILYRAGGSSAFNTKFRDLGVPIVVLGWFLILGLYHWTLLVSSLLLFGALTTYWKKPGTDAKWWNWALTGLGYSLSLLPYAVVFGSWVGFSLRIALLTTLTVVWSEVQDVDIIEEFGRGFLIVATLPLLLI